MIVIDASVLANAVGDDGGDGRRARAEFRGAGDVAAPDLVDVETVSVLRKRWLAGTVTDERFAAAVGDLAQLDLDRYPTLRFMRRAFELRARVAELELTADYQIKLQEEREQAREERELLREQRRAEAELAAEKERLDKERAHYVSVLEALRAKGDDVAAEELAGRLADIDKAIEANDYRIANIRAGYVYVISNIGALGLPRFDGQGR